MKHTESLQILSGYRISPCGYVTEKMNELNVQPQGHGEMISKVQAFSNKLTFWEHNPSRGEVKHFPCLKEKLEK